MQEIHAVESKTTLSGYGRSYAAVCPEAAQRRKPGRILYAELEIGAGSAQGNSFKIQCPPTLQAPAQHHSRA